MAQLCPRELVSIAKRHSWALGSSPPSQKGTVGPSGAPRHRKKAQLGPRELVTSFREHNCARARPSSRFWFFRRSPRPPLRRKRGLREPDPPVLPETGEPFSRSCLGRSRSPKSSMPCAKFFSHGSQSPSPPSGGKEHERGCVAQRLTRRAPRPHEPVPHPFRGTRGRSRGW